VNPTARFVATLTVVLAAVAIDPACSAAQGPASNGSKYPSPPSAMNEEDEVALAMSAAPPEVSSAADVFVLRGTEFVKVRSGTSGCACAVIRDSHEGSRYPICFDPEAARTVMRREMMETSLRARGMSETDVGREIRAAVADGRLAHPTRPALAYMMSPRQVLFSSPDSSGVRVGAWFPHIMMTGVGLKATDIGLHATSSYRYIQAGGEHGTLHEFVVLVPVWSDGTAAPAPSAPAR
jgi:hypothetical protein